MFLDLIDDKKNGGKLEVEICCHIQETKVWESNNRTRDVDVCWENVK